MADAENIHSTAGNTSLGRCLFLYQRRLSLANSHRKELRAKMRIPGSSGCRLCTGSSYPPPVSTLETKPPDCASGVYFPFGAFPHLLRYHRIPCHSRLRPGRQRNPRLSGICCSFLRPGLAGGSGFPGIPATARQQQQSPKPLSRVLQGNPRLRPDGAGLSDPL